MININYNGFKMEVKKAYIFAWLMLAKLSMGCVSLTEVSAKDANYR